jgi:hypothetical protein
MSDLFEEDSPSMAMVVKSSFSDFLSSHRLSLILVQYEIDHKTSFSRTSYLFCSPSSFFHVIIFIFPLIWALTNEMSILATIITQSL